MNISIIATTSETNTGITNEIKNALTTFSGKQAGICYMKDKYFGTYVSDNVKAATRFNTVANTGHHSIADHAKVTILFENISKMLAIVLNSLGDYATSEKSGRYTIMATESDEEILYNKWMKIFLERIKEIEPNLDERTQSKLAAENARYVISIFTPATTMSYTTSIRQINYIIDWCERYAKHTPNNTFEKRLQDDIVALGEELKASNLYIPELRDTKGRKFNILAKQEGYNIDQANESYGDSYLIKTKYSFAAFAQVERHRTIDYFICFDGNSKEFYIPECIRGTEYEAEWLADLNGIADNTPIATMIDVVETGLFSNYLLKCDERLCGRAQLETMKNVIETLQKFNERDELSPFMKEEMKRHYCDGAIRMKCNNIKCKEPCFWGPIKAQTKKV